MLSKKEHLIKEVENEHCSNWHLPKPGARLVSSPHLSPKQLVVVGHGEPQLQRVGPHRHHQRHSHGSRRQHYHHSIRRGLGGDQGCRENLPQRQGDQGQGEVPQQDTDGIGYSESVVEPSQLTGRHQEVTGSVRSGRLHL